MVTYIPDINVLTKAIKSIINQVDNLIVVDNTPNSILFDLKELGCHGSNLEVIFLHKNMGIATAQNIGIKKAIEDGCDFILLSDQDTYYPDNYVLTLINCFNSAPDNSKIAALAPRFLDLNLQGASQGFVIFVNFFTKRIFPISGSHIITQAIASGLLIPVSALKTIGLMTEELFIDWVDLEWCWRANSYGYYILGCADIAIQHKLGDSSKKVGSNTYPIRSAIRHYYIVRNSIHLAQRCNCINTSMRINLLFKAVLYLIGFSLLGKPRLKHFYFSIKGLYHGITNKLGEYK